MNQPKDNINPPKLAERFLLWFLKGDLAEEVLGDLDEKFAVMLDKHTASRARRNYWYQVFKYIRPFALKNTKLFRSNSLTMFKHNLLISYRSFLRFKSTFLINLIGLSSGLACTLLIYLWVSDEIGMDRFHEKNDNLYQVLLHNRWGDEVETETYTQHLLGPSLLESFPEVVQQVTVCEDWAETSGVISYEDKSFKAKDYQVGNDFFQVFSYNLLVGDPNTPLPNTSSVLISDEMAEKLFAGTDPTGKVLHWEQEEMSGDFAVAGIFQKPPKNSTKQFDLLFHSELLVERHDNFNSWNNQNESLFLVLQAGTNVDELNKKIEFFLKTKNENDKNTLSLQAYGDRYLYGTFANAKSVGGRIAYVRLFSLVALFILVIACINFMNLTTAKASNRMKEIGVKKAIGAQRSALMGQYLSESMLLASISLVVALALVWAFLPQFNQITGKQLSLISEFSWIGGALSITLIAGLLSGSYPAFYLSALRPISMLQGKLKASFGDTWIRKGLVVFQFGISAVLIIAVMVVTQQIDYIQSKNLGYNRDQLVRFDYVTDVDQGYEAFLSELKSIPGVVAAAGAVDDATGMHGGTSYVAWPGKEEGSRTYFKILVVGYDFLETMQIEMAAGRAYENGRDEPGRSKMIFNERAIELMGIEDPIGKVVKVQGEDSQIIGIVKDFHFQSMYNDIDPLYIQLGDEVEYTLLKIQAGTELETLKAVEKVHQSRLPGFPFDARFIDDDFQSMYESEKSISTLSRYFAGIAVIISCLGLLGLATFTAEKRTKEIGIRKVLGSGNWRIIYLLSADLTKLVVLALFIALPLSYFMANSWLQNFAFGIDLQAWHFALAGIVTLLLALSVAGIQTIKAARANPVEALRAE